MPVKWQCMFKRSYNQHTASEEGGCRH